MAKNQTELKVDLTNLKGLNRAIKQVVTKAVKPVQKEIKQAIKDDAPVDTGALKSSIWDKVVWKKNRASVVIGPRTQYEKFDKIPNMYAKKEDEKTHFISGNKTDAVIQQMHDAAAQAIKELLSK